MAEQIPIARGIGRRVCRDGVKRRFRAEARPCVFLIASMESRIEVERLRGGAMASWFFEPGHTAAEFCARHMMVTCVRGHFKDVHGTRDFDPGNPSAGSVEAIIDARRLWS